MKNTKFSFDQTTYQLLYIKYKDFIMPAVIIFVCLILVLFIVIPQVKELNQIRQEEKTVAEKIEKLERDLNFLSSLDNSSLETERIVTTKALPIEKDFAGIIRAVTNTAVGSGVALDDFGFSVGLLSTESVKLNVQPSIKLVITIKSDTEKAKTFLKKISKAFPLSEITTINVEDNIYSIALDFFYKSFPYTPYNNMPRNLLTSEHKKIIEDLSTWEKESINAPVTELSGNLGSESSVFDK